MISMPTTGHKSYLLLILILAGICFTAPAAQGQGQEDRSVRDSAAVLNEIMAIPAQRIPQNLLAGAEGIAIIPRVIKGGFVIGARHGRGTLLIRDEKRGWHAPVFISLTGGSIGWQAGVQSTDVILVFKTKKSIQGILSGKFTLGVDAAAAAGPVGRQASAATDLHLQAEVYSYARSRGLFLGASLDGSMLQINGMSNAAYYRSPGPGLPVTVPPAALELVQLVSRYCGGAPPIPVVATGPAGAVVAAPLAGAPGAPGAISPAPTPGPAILAQEYATQESTVIRDQLGKTSPELFDQLDPAWKSYLALPAPVFSRQGHPPIEALQQSLQHYDKVRQDPQYQALATMPEFQSTYGLLKHYLSTLSHHPSQLTLPPPPLAP